MSKPKYFQIRQFSAEKTFEVRPKKCTSGFWEFLKDVYSLLGQPKNDSNSNPGSNLLMIQRMILIQIRVILILMIQKIYTLLTFKINCTGCPKTIFDVWLNIEK